MELKHIGIGIVGTILVIGGIWGFMIQSYEEDIGTKNIFVEKKIITFYYLTT